MLCLVLQVPLRNGKAYGGKLLHNLQDTLKARTPPQLLQFAGNLTTAAMMQTMQHQSKGVATFESMQAVQYLSVQVTFCRVVTHIQVV